MEEDAKSELSGEFLDAVLALLMPKDEYEARCLRETFEGFGTNEQELIELVCTKDGKEIRTLGNTYKQRIFEVPTILCSTPIFSI